MCVILTEIRICLEKIDKMQIVMGLSLKLQLAKVSIKHLLQFNYVIIKTGSELHHIFCHDNGAWCFKKFSKSKAMQSFVVVAQIACKENRK